MVKTPIVASTKNDTKDALIDFWLRTVSYRADRSERSGDKKSSLTQAFDLFEWINVYLVIEHYKVSKNYPLVQVFGQKKSLKEHFFELVGELLRAIEICNIM